MKEKKKEGAYLAAPLCSCPYARMRALVLVRSSRGRVPVVRCRTGSGPARLTLRVPGLAMLEYNS